jgi:hypothetical protein
MSNENQMKITVEEMINFIAKKSTLHQFLERNKIMDIDTIHEIIPYERDDYRRGLIVDVKEKNADARSKIMIDLKQGQPIINQVYDSLYTVGKDCEKRIVLYSGGQNDYDKDVPIADTVVVRTAVSNLQEYPLGIYLFKMDENTFIIEPPCAELPWSQDTILTVDQIPTREQFMTDVFWLIYFDSFNESFYNPLKIFRDGFEDTSFWFYEIGIDCSFSGEILLKWDQKGFKYKVIQQDDSDEYLKKVLDFEMPALQERYGSESVEFENVVGKLPRLRIRYSDRPFSWLYNASPRQITQFAKAVYDDAWALRWRIEERIDGLVKKESA